MNKEDLIKKIEDIKNSMDDTSFLNEKTELDELKQVKTINPIKKHKLKKQINDLEEKIEQEKSKLKNEKLKQIQKLQKEIKRIEQKEYFANHKKAIICSAILGLTLILSVSAAAIYNSDVRKLQFITDYVEINAGESIDFSYVVKPGNLDETKLSKIEVVFEDEFFDVSNNKYQTVKDGETAAYLVYDGKEFDRMQIKINTVPVTEISFADTEIGLGRELIIDPLYLPENATHKEILITSENSDIVSAEGNVLKAKELGETYITITSADGPKCKTKIEVKPVPIESITIKGKKDITRLDESNYSVEFVPADATYKNIVWSVSDSTFGSIDENGLFKSSKTGSVDIIAKSEVDDIETVFTININPILVSSFEVVEEEMRVTEGNTKQIRCTNIMPENADENTFKYESSDVSIAAVDENGVIKGISPGKTKVHITTNDSNFKNSISVIVDEKIEYTANGNQKSGITVYVSKKGKYHRKSNCSGMKSYTAMDLNDAIGVYTACSSCN